LASEKAIAAALIERLSGGQQAKQLAVTASRRADEQRAIAWRRIGALLAVTEDGTDLSEEISSVGRQSPWHLTYICDALVPVLTSLSDEARSLVFSAARLHDARWRAAIRRHLDSTVTPDLVAARLLEEIGEKEDVRRLRAIAKKARRNAQGADLGRALSRRVAHRVVVEDQGRVSIICGEREIPGTSIRRKVLALLCFLIARGFAATKDQVLDALWPDLSPDVAANSLNQTLYFLRRVFEEDYSEDLSPGYVWNDSDMVWLDAELVTSRSASCRTLLRGFEDRPTPDEVDQLVGMYLGRFALDFEYEEWAASYRDPLHASYLDVVERAVMDDFHGGHFDRGISIARRALEIDPGAEQVEVSLLRLYKATGAHAAAAEQYAHYAAVVRGELGVEPPPLDSL
jgi:DNA-binding SARP family transcriptional activator